MPQGINGATITGFEEIIRNLDKDVRQITQGSKSGLRRAANFIHRETEGTQPITPMSKGGGFLRSSWYNKPVQENLQHGIEFGYAANYAKWVHFMEGTKERPIRWTRPGSGALWLQKAIERNYDQILQIVASGINDNR